MIELALIFSAMLAGHYIADRVLQPGWLSQHKRSDALLNRWQALALHGVAHGFFVAIITGSALLALAEAMAHAAIDRGRGRGWYGMGTDQALHVLCKLAWVAALAVHR